MSNEAKEFIFWVLRALVNALAEWLNDLEDAKHSDVTKVP